MKSIDPEYHRQYYLKNRHKWKTYSKRDYEKRKDEIAKQRATPERRAALSAYLKQWRAENVEKRARDMRAWAKKNKEHIKEYRSEYAGRRRELYQERRTEILARKKQIAHRYRNRVNGYQRKRRKTDIQFMLAGRLRATLVRALRRQYIKKSKRTMELIGCTPQELKAHIEQQFVDGMSWENRHLIHIDHIRPLASFDLRDVEQQRAAMNFRNLRPLWKADNHRKSDKWTP